MVKFVNLSGGFLGEFILVTLIFGAAWKAAWVTLGAPLNMDSTFTLSAIPSLAFCAAAVLLRRGKQISIRSRLRLSFIVARCIYAGICGLHFVRGSPTRFTFLADHPAEFRLVPAIPGHIETAYTFRCNPERLTADATAVLISAGFRVEAARSTMTATLRKSPSNSSEGVSVSICQGRALGKHFAVDGEMLDIQKRNDWVTADVIEPDVVPWWIRIVAP